MRLDRFRAPVLVLLCVLALGAACGGARPDAAAISTPTPEVTASPSSTPTAPASVATAEAPPALSAAATPAPSPASTAAPVVIQQQAPRDARPVAALPVASSVRTVVVDPGHGGDEVGAAANGVVEKQSNLDMAFRVEALLAAQGVRVVMTRRADERAYVGPPVAGYTSTRRDLQARIDLANDSGADVFVSIHSNGALSAAERGIETYYNSQRPHSALNLQLAQTVQSSVINEVTSAGFFVTDRGAKDDACLRGFRGRCFGLFLLAPARTTTREEVIARGGNEADLARIETSSRATDMPAVLVELLFTSNPSDAAILRDEAARDAMARGIARGVLEFLAAQPRTG